MAVQGGPKTDVEKALNDEVVDDAKSVAGSVPVVDKVDNLRLAASLAHAKGVVGQNKVPTNAALNNLTKDLNPENKKVLLDSLVIMAADQVAGKSVSTRITPANTSASLPNVQVPAAAAAASADSTVHGQDLAFLNYEHAQVLESEVARKKIEATYKSLTIVAGEADCNLQAYDHENADEDETDEEEKAYLKNPFRKKLEQKMEETRSAMFHARLELKGATGDEETRALSFTRTLNQFMATHRYDPFHVPADAQGQRDQTTNDMFNQLATSTSSTTSTNNPVGAQFQRETTLLEKVKTSLLAPPVAKMQADCENLVNNDYFNHLDRLRLGLAESRDGALAVDYLTIQLEEVRENLLMKGVVPPLATALPKPPSNQPPNGPHFMFGDNPSPVGGGSTGTGQSAYTSAFQHPGVGGGGQPPLPQFTNRQPLAGSYIQPPGYGGSNMGQNFSVSVLVRIIVLINSKLAGMCPTLPGQ
jgi:hypothetical protein